MDTFGSPSWESPGSIHVYSPALKVAPPPPKKKEKKKENKIVMRGAVSRFTYHCILKSDSSENVHLSWVENWPLYTEWNAFIIYF